MKTDPRESTRRTALSLTKTASTGTVSSALSSHTSCHINSRKKQEDNDWNITQRRQGGDYLSRCPIRWNLSELSRFSPISHTATSLTRLVSSTRPCTAALSTTPAGTIHHRQLNRTHHTKPLPCPLHVHNKRGAWAGIISHE